MAEVPLTPPAQVEAQAQEASRLSLLLLVGWLALVVAGAALGVAAHSTQLLPGDLALSHAIQQPHGADPVLAPLLTLASVPGNSPWQWVLYGLAVAVPLALRRWSTAALLALTATGDAMGGSVKLIVARTRPTADLVHVLRQAAGYSFPSGHVVHYVVFFGALAYVCSQALHGGTTSTLRLLALHILRVACLTLIALVGVSRVYLGAHWPSDVIGGYLLGGAWLALLLFAYWRWIHERFGPGRPHP